MIHRVLDFIGEIAKLPLLPFVSFTKKKKDEDEGDHRTNDLILKVAGAIILLLIGYGMAETSRKIEVNSTINERQWANLSTTNQKLAENCAELRHLSDRLTKLESRLEPKR